MRKFLLSVAILLSFLQGYSQKTSSISGRVFNKETGEPLGGATITIKGDIISGIADRQGHYSLNIVNAGRVSILFSHSGYSAIDIWVTVAAGEKANADVGLVPTMQVTESVVVSASRRTEKITDAPASIQVIGHKELSQFAGSNVGELAAHVQGLEFVRMGVDNVSFNARGLNNAFNNKVFQMVDGRNSMQPLSGSLLMGNNFSVNKEDIDRIEVLLGPQTALYGPNVHNALLNFITKDPRKYQGTTLAITLGNQQQFSGRFRHAEQINKKWAYKLTGESATGKDFEFYDNVYVGGGPNGVFGPVRAVPEKIDFNFRHLRGEGHLYYSFNQTTGLILSAGGSKNNTINTHTGGHNQFVDITNSFIQARFVSPRFYATVYNSWADFGKSYSVVGYTRDFWNRTHSTAASGPNARLTPEEAEIFAKLPGNSFKENPQRLNADAQYNYHLSNAGIFLTAGLSYQKDKPRGFGINLVDSFDRIYVTQYGGVLQLEKTLPLALRFIGATRVDHHSNFGSFVSPKLALTKNIGSGTARVTWGRAYSMPSILYQYARTGGLFFGNGEGISYLPNGAKSSDASSIKTTVRLVPEEVNTWELGYKGNITQKLTVDLTYYNGLSKHFFTPSIGVGGRALYVGGKRVTHNPAFAGTVVNDTLRGANFLTIFNFGDVRVYGLDIGASYDFSKLVNFSLRYSWMGSDITKGNAANDANRDGFVLADERSLNGPANRGTAIVTIGNLQQQRAFTSVVARYVQQYDFYSGNQISTEAGKGKRGVVQGPDGSPRYDKNFDWGPLGGFAIFDLSAGYRVNNIVTIVGNVSNLFDAQQREFAGSPVIGRLMSVELKAQIPRSKKDI